MKAIEVIGVHYRYDDGTEALAGIDFAVAAGEFVAVLGSNGSGKTTLINLLVGLLKARSGGIRINGRAIGELSAEELYQRVGLVFQNPNDQLFAATVEEDVAFGPRNLNLPEAEVQQRVTGALAAVAALPLRGRAIHHLSFGEQKRVALAGVIAMRPAILILDEPTAGLDPAGEAQMMQLLKGLNRDEGLTIVLATHSVDMLPLFANRITVLDRGRVLCEGPAEEIFCHQEMIVRAKLRLPYVSRLLYEMKRHDGVPIDRLPLTIGEARAQLLELIPKDLIIDSLKEETKP
ncbi:MAG: energy-coupling factor ABC transporter ATP-binding protein [Syntrophales bacterium]